MTNGWLLLATLSLIAVLACKDTKPDPTPVPTVPTMTPTTTPLHAPSVRPAASVARADDDTGVDDAGADEEEWCDAEEK